MSSAVRDYRDLEVWQKAVELAVQVYLVVKRLPRSEQFRFGDQMVRAATSVAANIAEGYGRRRRAEYIRFLDIANGSRCEIETQFEVCTRLEVISGAESEVLRAQSERIGRMLTGLRSRLVRLNP